MDLCDEQMSYSAHSFVPLSKLSDILISQRQQQVRRLCFCSSRGLITVACSSSVSNFPSVLPPPLRRLPEHVPIIEREAAAGPAVCGMIVLMQDYGEMREFV